MGRKKKKGSGHTSKRGKTKLWEGQQVRLAHNKVFFATTLVKDGEGRVLVEKGEARGSDAELACAQERETPTSRNRLQEELFKKKTHNLGRDRGVLRGGGNGQGLNRGP